MKKLSLLLLVLPLVLGVTPALAQEKDPDGTVSSEPGGTGTVEPYQVGPVYPGEVKLFVNGDQVDAIPAGARATVVQSFTNSGDKVANDVSVKLSEAGDGVTIVDGAATLGDIAPEKSADATFVFDVAEKPCEQDFAAVGGKLTSSVGDSDLKLGFPVLCPGPRLWLAGIEYKGGDGDGIAEPGERLTVVVTLQNGGRDAATDVAGTLTIKSDDVTVVEGSATWPDIASGKTAVQNVPFIIQVSEDAKVEKACAGGPGPDILVVDEKPVDNGDTPTQVAPVPADEPQSEPGSSGSGSSGSTGSAGGAIEPDPAPGEEPPPARGDEPAPEPQPAPDDGVMFEANASVTASGKTFDIPFGNNVYCALAAEGRHGAPAPDAKDGGATQTGDKQLLAGARDEAARSSGGRSGAVATAALLMLCTVMLIARAKLQRRATQ